MKTADPQSDRRSGSLWTEGEAWPRWVSTTGGIPSRFDVQSLLGRGGMGVVLRVTDSRLQVERALKVLNPQDAADPEVRKRFQREARAMASLDHANIVPVHDLHLEGPTPFFVMSLMTGGSLADQLRDGPMESRAALHVVRKVLEGLEAAHLKAIVHRDIKPGNVLFDEVGVPRLTDFGIARVLDVTRRLTQTGTVMGTYAYMAPEQHLDLKRVDDRADLYGVGATLYAMLTARKPYGLHGEELSGERLGCLPEPCARLIHRATRFDPEDRFASATAMIESVDQALADLPDPDAAPVAFWQKPTVSGLTLGVAAFSLLVGGVVGAAWMRLATPVQEPAPVQVVEAQPEAVDAPVLAAPEAELPVSEVPELVEEPVADEVAEAEVAEAPKVLSRPRQLAPALDPGTVIVNAMPPQASVMVDGSEQGSLRKPFTLEPGRHELTLTPEHGAPYTRIIEVESGSTTRICWDFRAGAPCVGG